MDIDENLTIVGTAHVSPESVKEVEDTIAEVKPDIVAVELDAKRLEALKDQQKWEDTKIVDLIKGGNAFFFLGQIFLSSVQRRLGEKFGAKPGDEMLAAVNAADGAGLRIELVDRDIGITMKKAYRSMGAVEKIKLVWHFTKALVGAEEDEDVDLEEIMKEDVISLMIEELSQVAPSVTRILIFERDSYIAKKLAEAKQDGKVVAVVGAGHLKGIQENLADIEKAPSFEELESIPAKGFGPIWAMAGFFLFLIIGGAVLDLFIPAGQGDPVLGVLPLLKLNVTVWFIIGGIIGGPIGFVVCGLKRFRAIAYTIPGLIIVMVLSLIYTGGGVNADNSEELLRIFIIWFGINGLFSALGAAAALGHPFSIATAFFAAPFTSLHPGVAAGWFAGYVQARVSNPTVKDFEEISSISRGREFYTNKVLKVLMVTALANVGSAVATWVAAGMIFLS